MDTETNVEELTTTEEWTTAIPLLQQLWTDTTAAVIRTWQAEPDYRLFGLYGDGELVGVAGISVQRVLHHTRHAWIHDFVIDTDCRGNGYGSTLLAWVREWAGERDCECIALAAKLENESAQRFYEKNDVKR